MAGVTQKALKYYEKIGILSPAYIDPDSLYRYYSYKQLYFVGLITIFIELDIPLKEITTYITNGENIDYKSFLTRGANLAKEKIKRLQNNLSLINQLQDSLDRAEMKDNYEQQLPEKYVYVSPYNQALSEDEINQHFLEFYKIIQDKNLITDDWFGEAGIWVSQINNDYQINNAKTIFEDTFKENASNIVVETEIFVNKSVYDEPKKELRILTKVGENDE